MSVTVVLNEKIAVISHLWTCYMYCICLWDSDCM